LLKLVTDEQFSETTTDVNDKEIRRIGGKIDNIKVCCFIVPKIETTNSSIFEFSNRKINLQNVNYVIKAKKQYSNKNEKHKKDLEEIEINLTF
jgi:hypothetical protein